MPRFRSRAFLAPVLAALLVVSLSAAASADPGGVPNDNAAFGQSHKRVCPPNGPQGEAACHAEVVTKKDGATPAATVTYASGYSPADLASAYNYTLPPAGSAWNWNGQTVALVLAYDNPSAEADLAQYRARFGLPACTSASGCFRKVNQAGVAGSYPQANVGWAQESALDLDMASATCPNCKLLLVEATNNSLANLGAAVNTAANLGANVISNSYGASEFSSETSYDANYYNHPGKAITVSSGDSGYGTEFPAVSRYVTAVGGTKLTRSTGGRGWTETTWKGAGSGCSSYVAKPSWQPDTGCARRMIADVSAVADPNTGVAVYVSTGSSGNAYWYVFGGTSVAAPLVGGLYGLAANSSGIDYPVKYAYSSPGSLFDITWGNNGKCNRKPSYYCNALVGYDGPTGLGTPNGIGAF